MTIRSLFVIALISPSLMPTDTSHAQDDEETVEEIVVTGSRIPRRDLVLPSPIATLDAADLELAAQLTIQDTLSQRTSGDSRSTRATVSPRKAMPTTRISI